MDFLEIKNRAELAGFLGIPLKQLTYLAYSNSVMRYKEFKIPKKTPGKFRKIKAPRKDLKAIQLELLLEFEKLYTALPCVHGFTKDRSIATNASCHTKKQAILNIDLEDFFPSITQKRIQGLFLKEPFSFPMEVANALSILVSEEDGLPQGAPTSPILSNMICFVMDARLLALAAQKRVTYTRYADDLTFSSTGKYAMRSLISMGNNNTIVLNRSIISIIEENGFRINGKKVHLASNNKQQTVTGIVVNKKCNFARKDYRALRVALHNWVNYEVEFAASAYCEAFPEYYSKLHNDKGLLEPDLFESHIRGKLAFFDMIVSQNNKPSAPLQNLGSLFYKATNGRKPIAQRYEDSIFQLTICYDCFDTIKSGKKSCFSMSGTGFILKKYGLITCEHCLRDKRLQPICDAQCQCEVAYRRFNTTGVHHINCFRFIEEHDIASLPYAEIGYSLPSLSEDLAYRPQVGEIVTAYGFADGDSTMRVIKAEVAEVLHSGETYRVDRPFIKGMSGGPVINARGKVIGIITQGSSSFDYSKDGYFCSIEPLACL